MMKLPHIIAAGVYRHEERYSQRMSLPGISFYVKGLHYQFSYFPDGKLHSSSDHSSPPCLALFYPGMRSEFEFGPERENWVLMLDWPALSFCEQTHQFELCDGDARFPLPDRIFPEPYEIPFLREQFSDITKSFRGAMPRTILQAEFQVTSILKRFLEQPQIHSPAERLKKMIDADQMWLESISELSKHTGYSRDYLRREFQKNYGVSPAEYRQKRRLHEIIQLLIYSNLSLKEIAYQTGMKHVTHLYAFLKQHSDHTPAELLRRYRKDSVEIPLQVG